MDKALAADEMPDAWVAAAVIQQGEHGFSFDADFKQHLAPSQQHQAEVLSPVLQLSLDS